MAWYTAVVNSDGSGDGTTMVWNSQTAGGFVTGIRVEYGGTPAATTDVTIDEPYGLERDILVLTDTNTDAVYYPTFVYQENDGTARTQAMWPLVTLDNLRVTVAQAVVSTTAAVTVKVQLMQLMG